MNVQISQCRPCESRDPYALPPVYRVMLTSLLHCRAASMSARGYGSPPSRGRRSENRHWSNSTYDFAISPRIPREFCISVPPSSNRGRRECRAPDAPAAARGVVVSTRVSHHERTGSPGIPARNGFNGFLRALLGDRALLSPSPANESANLTPTIEASGPHDFAVRM